MITVNVINTALLLGFLTIASAYILYFGILTGLPPIILIESIIVAFIAGVLIKQRMGAIASSITYVALLTIITIVSTTITGVMATHVYAGILLAVNIVLVILGIGLIKR